MAATFREDAKRRVPRRSGRTQAAIVAIKGSKATGYWADKAIKYGAYKSKIDFPFALYALDYRISRIGHLIEFGTGPRVQASTGRAVGAMPAQPFFRPPIDAWRDWAASYLQLETAKLVMKAAVTG